MLLPLFLLQNFVMVPFELFQKDYLLENSVGIVEGFHVQVFRLYNTETAGTDSFDGVGGSFHSAPIKIIHCGFKRVMVWFPFKFSNIDIID